MSEGDCTHGGRAVGLKVEGGAERWRVDESIGLPPTASARAGDWRRHVPRLKLGTEPPLHHIRGSARRQSSPSQSKLLGSSRSFTRGLNRRQEQGHSILFHLSG